MLQMAGPGIALLRIEQVLQLGPQALECAVKPVRRPGSLGKLLQLARFQLDDAAHRIRAAGQCLQVLRHPVRGDDRIGIGGQNAEPHAVQRVALSQPRPRRIHQPATGRAHMRVLRRERSFRDVEAHLRMCPLPGARHLRRSVGAVVQEQQHFIRGMVQRLAVDVHLRPKRVECGRERCFLVARRHDHHGAASLAGCAFDEGWLGNEVRHKAQCAALSRPAGKTFCHAALAHIRSRPP